ncbi:MAG: hypothetical protein AAGG72_08430 [Pseudomonadota bacterium]
MDWSLRIGLGCMGVGAAGLALLAFHAPAESSHGTMQNGYVLALSQGARLIAEDGDRNDARSHKSGQVHLLNQSGADVVCHSVFRFGTIEFGADCQSARPVSQLSKQAPGQDIGVAAYR